MNKVFLIFSNHVTSKGNPDNPVYWKRKETETHLLKQTSLAANSIMPLFIFKLIWCNVWQNWRFVPCTASSERTPPNLTGLVDSSGKTNILRHTNTRITQKYPKLLEAAFCTNLPPTSPIFFSRCCGLSGT